MTKHLAIALSLGAVITSFISCSSGVQSMADAESGPQLRIVLSDNEARLPEDSVIVISAEPIDSTLIQPPTLLTQVPPQYPEDGMKAGLEGDVRVIAYVRADGHVSRAFVAQTTDQMFNRPALKAAMFWRFSPATYKGKAIPLTVAMPFHFRLYARPQR